MSTDLIFARAIADMYTHLVPMLANVEVSIDGVDSPALLRPGYTDQTFDGPGPAGSSPSVMLAAANVPDRPAGMRLVIQTGWAAGAYKVTSHEPDGSGMVALHLTKTT